MTKERKQEVINAFKREANDTGSSEVQIALLTQQINDLTAHLKANKHDNSSRRGLFVLVGKRRGLLDYLARNNHEEYVALIKELGIRK